jgi:hypothetical protein
MNAEAVLSSSVFGECLGFSCREGKPHREAL